MILGIDASRNRSGGAISYLKGILEFATPTEFGISKIHLWSYPTLLDSIQSHPWLVKHSPGMLSGSLFQQLWWQRFRFPSEATKAGCDFVFNTDAGTVSKFRPCLTLSQDMLSYEPGEINRFGFGRARLRLIALRYVQNAAFRQSEGVIFLTNYAAKTIQQSCGTLKNIAVIPHGVGAEFLDIEKVIDPKLSKTVIRCIYVSNAALYKHQWTVARAISILKSLGYNIVLSFIGGGKGKGARLLAEQINACDPSGEFIKCFDFVPHYQLPTLLQNADIFIFASSCENLPITLLEGMAAGLPIACSDRGPMPEVLKDGGVYFDPEDEQSIVNALEALIEDYQLRLTVANTAKSLARDYAWEHCSSETFSFIQKTYSSLQDDVNY